MKPGVVVAVGLAVAGAALSIGVAVHEWSYHRDHPGRTGCLAYYRPGQEPRWAASPARSWRGRSDAAAATRPGRV